MKGLDADHPDIPCNSMDIAFRDTVGAHNLSVVLKAFA
jgi:hypothetical protein